MLEFDCADGWSPYPEVLTPSMNALYKKRYEASSYVEDVNDDALHKVQFAIKAMVNVSRTCCRLCLAALTARGRL